MFIMQLKYHLFFPSFFKKFFIWILVQIVFEHQKNEHKRAPKKKDGLKEAQDLSLAPYDR